MGTLYSWKTLYSVNIAALDGEHKKLFALINDLSGAMDNKGVVAGVLDELIAYTQSHFAAEEALMKMYRFPSLADHKAEHDALAHKILGFRKSVAEGKLCVSASLLLFLSNWLSAHILKTDKQYSHFFNEFGLY